MRTDQVKKIFIEYFKGKGHTVVPSSSLLPKNDPSIMFTNAGMNQFKDLFMGLDSREYTRATSVQKCVRAGGKHNDLDMVGKTARHHTFFEMLGNFSFGDYFKRDAIKMAWDLLTNYYNIDQERLYITVHESDDEAYKIWRDEVKVPEHKIYKMGDKDNFWSMGELGPCGPSSEIFYDHGKEYACSDSCDVGCDCDRFVEIWNLVFMQYNRLEDGSLEPLPKKNVDTGAGVERLSAVLQGVLSNYDIDLFKDIKNEISILFSKKEENNKVAFNVIADHIRAISFLVADGLVPSNEGAGYVLRRIIRRAVRYAKQLGADSPILFNLVDKLVELMGEAYPDLKKANTYIKQVLEAEEKAFYKTLDKGLRLIETELRHAKEEKEFSADFVFKLYDTYGFPVDLTSMILADYGLTFDENKVKVLMDKQRAKARSSSKFSVKIFDTFGNDLQGLEISPTKFLGYDTREGEAKLLFIKDLGTKFFAVFDKTPFYAESGGQVADKGVILRGSKIVAKVLDVQKSVNKLIVHSLELLDDNVNLERAERYTLKVDEQLRRATERNHTATHLLQAILQKYLGKHVKQAGSFVSSELLRFDFTHTEALCKDTLRKIEYEINLLIEQGIPVNTKFMEYDKALKLGAMALFDEKYDREVRVVSIGELSKELCGGTHVKNTKDLMSFRITTELSVASGIRRIEALTGLGAYKFVTENLNTLGELSVYLKQPVKNILATVKKQTLLIKEQEQLIKRFKKLEQKEFAKTLLEKADKIANYPFIFARLNAVKPKDFVSVLRGLVNDAIFVLYTQNGDKISILIDVSRSLTDRISAREIFDLISSKLGLKGGGSKEFVQAGGLVKFSIGNDIRQVIYSYLKDRLEA